MTRISLHTVAASVLSGDTSAALAVKTAEVTMDDSWSPFVQGSLVCHIPDDVNVRDAIDPRLEARLSIVIDERVGVSGTLGDLTADWGTGTLGALYGSGTLADITDEFFEPWNPDGVTGSRLHLNVGIRRRHIDHRYDEMTVEFASDEALLQDYALLSTVPETPGSTSVKTAVVYALGKIGAALDTSATDADVDEADALTWYPGTTGWDYLIGLVQMTNLRLWCTERGVWRLDPRDELLDQPTVLSEFTEAAEDIDRDGEWCDGVVVEYEWTDASDVRHLRRDTAGDSTSRRVILVNYSTPWPGRGAAQRILDRANRRGRVLDLEAVSRYSVYPAGPLTALPPDTPAQTGIVERVTFTITEDRRPRMRVRSRGLVDTNPAAWLLIPAGSSWLAEPTAASWVDEQIGVS